MSIIRQWLPAAAPQQGAHPYHTSTSSSVNSACSDPWGAGLRQCCCESSRCHVPTWNLSLAQAMQSSKLATLSRANTSTTLASCSRAAASADVFTVSEEADGGWRARKIYVGNKHTSTNGQSSLVQCMLPTHCAEEKPSLAPICQQCVPAAAGSGPR